MQQNGKKIIGLLLAAALWLGVPAVANAAAPTLLKPWPEDMYSPDFAYFTYDDADVQADALYLEPYATTTTDSAENKKTFEEPDYYEVTIPASVSLSDENKTATLEMSGTLHAYRDLTVTVESTNGNQLICGDSTNTTSPRLAYSLTASNKENMTVSTDETTNAPICTAETKATEAEFKVDYALTVTDTATMSGEYTDTLTFTFVCAPKTYTITYHDNTASDNKTEVKYECGTYATLGQNSFENGDLHFAGWSTTESVDKTVEAYDALLKENKTVTATDWSDLDNTAENQNFDLYAQWGHQCTLVVTYEAVDESTDTTMETQTIEKVVPENATYTWTRTRDASDSTDEKSGRMQAVHLKMLYRMRAKN